MYVLVDFINVPCQVELNRILYASQGIKTKGPGF